MHEEDADADRAIATNASSTHVRWVSTRFMVNSAARGSVRRLRSRVL